MLMGKSGRGSLKDVAAEFVLWCGLFLLSDLFFSFVAAK